MRQNILKQLFDIRPTRSAGELDVEKIQAVTAVVDLRGRHCVPQHFKPLPIAVRTSTAIVPLVEEEPVLIPEEPVHISSAAAPTPLSLEEVRATLASTLEVFERADQRRKALLRFLPVEATVLVTEDVPETKELEPAPMESAVTEPEPLPTRLFPEVSLSIELAKAVPDVRSRRARSLKIVMAVGAVVFLGLGALAAVGMVGKRVHALTEDGQEIFAGLAAGLTELKAGHWQEARLRLTAAQEKLAAFQAFVNKRGFASMVAVSNKKSAEALGAFIDLTGTALGAGRALSEGGERLFAPGAFRSVLSVGASSGKKPSGEILAGLSSAEAKFREADALLGRLASAIGVLPPEAIPAEYKEKLFALSDEMPVVRGLVEKALEGIGQLRLALGEGGTKKYLLLLENSSELRPAGGFPGTYGLAEFRDGELVNFFLDGIYNPDGQLTVQVVPPKALQRVSPFWGMRDAGWFFDFPTSARKFAWFYEHAGGPKVDGVIALTPRFIERLLAVTGPFTMPEYGQERIDEHNFIEVLQYEVEADFDPKAGNPKKILTDLAPKFLKRLGQADEEDTRLVLEAVKQSLAEKDIQISMFDRAAQAIVDEAGWSGRVGSAADGGDYLALVHTNVAGGKADWVTDDEILQEISIDADGTITKTVSVTRKHRGGNTPYAWWNAPNKDYLRILVPRGSTLLAATGFEARDEFSRTPRKKDLLTDPDIMLMEGTLRHDAASHLDVFREHDKDAFAGWLVVPAGGSRTVTLRYALPKRLSGEDVFSVLVQKQAGLKPLPVTTRILFPSDWALARYPVGAVVSQGLAEITEPFTKDISYRLQFLRK